MLIKELRNLVFLGQSEIVLSKPIPTGKAFCDLKFIHQRSNGVSESNKTWSLMMNFLRRKDSTCLANWVTVTVGKLDGL